MESVKYREELLQLYSSELTHLSMQVVFMVSSLMYSISVAWAN